MISMFVAFRWAPAQPRAAAQRWPAPWSRRAVVTLKYNMIGRGDLRVCPFWGFTGAHEYLISNSGGVPEGSPQPADCNHRTCNDRSLVSLVKLG